MLVEPAALVAALRLPPGTEARFEPLGEAPAAPERVALRTPDGGSSVVFLRRSLDPDAAANHLAVMEALSKAGFAAAPALLGALGDATGVATIEAWVEGLTALAVVPPPGAAEAAIEALAALHALPIREGLDWGAEPGDLIAGADGEEVPLHRLGFASDEREPAREPLAQARAALLETPFGFAHRDATAAHILLAPNCATIVNFEQAGFGPQLFDVAAFLLTSGLEPAARRALAAAYARLRSIDPMQTIDLIDLAGILWGIAEMLVLPRRLIEALGDDAASERIRTCASRIDHGIHLPAGEHPATAAIRTALWPG